MNKYIYALCFLLVTITSMGVLPISTLLLVGVIILIYLFIVPPRLGIVFFVSFIPFFTALPFTQTFDSFNLWRLASLLLFLKWLWVYKKSTLQNTLYILKNIRKSIVNYPIFTLTGLLMFTTLISVIIPVDTISAVLRFIYFANLLLIAFPLYDLLKGDDDFLIDLFKGIRLTAIIVLSIGFVQLLMTYVLTADVFLWFWSQQIQSVWFGSAWGDIASSSNTWFSYFQHNFILRMFSVFTSSHVFPIYLIMSLPAFIATTKRTPWYYVILFLLLLGILLSSTRGIWLASIVSLITSILLVVYYKRDEVRRSMTKHSLVVMLLFIFAFIPAYGIYKSNQFMQSNGSLRDRISSIFDLNELSNKGRINIWQKTIKSIAQNPVEGVGIGNYPVVLLQDVVKAKAGSTAHNIYLHVFAELGIIAGGIFIVILIMLLYRAFVIFKLTTAKIYQKYSLFILLGFLWLFAYLITDATLFDERVFLLFLTNVIVVNSIYEQVESKTNA